AVVDSRPYTPKTCFWYPPLTSPPAVRTPAPASPDVPGHHHHRLEAIYTEKTPFWCSILHSHPPQPCDHSRPLRRPFLVTAVVDSRPYTPKKHVFGILHSHPSQPRDHPRPLRRPFLVTAVVDSSHIHQKPRFWVFQAPASRIEVRPPYLRRSITPYDPPHQCERSRRPRRPLHVVGAHVLGPYRPKARLLSIPSPSTQDSALRALALASQASQRRRRGHP
ncbi:hypothetical protein B0H10DRAFT_2445042, partial [Mycena sp. CBHHK59/15]